jgi:hypothetical protein
VSKVKTRQKAEGRRQKEREKRRTGDEEMRK